MKERAKKVSAQLEKVVDETITNTANLFRNMYSDLVLATVEGILESQINQETSKL